MDKAEREAIWARCEAATPGPWVCREKDPVLDGEIRIIANGGANCIAKTVPYEIGWGISQNEHDANAEFIARARQDVPALLDALEESEEECLDAKADRERWKAELRSDRDLWKACAKALELAIKSVSFSPCDVCAYSGKAGQQWCRDNCGSELLKWQFDEARFAPEDKNAEV